MKKTLIAIVAAIVIGTLGVTFAFAGGDKNTQDDLHKADKGQTDILSDGVVNDQLTHYEEFDMISEQIDTENLIGTVVEDNQGKRVIVFANENGEEQYKTIFVKKNNYLKVIAFDDGQIFHGNIHGEQVSEQEHTETAKSEGTENTKESTVVSNHIDLNKYTGKVVEDNKNKRVMVYVDSKGNEQYKSIYLKHKNYIKVIDFNDGLLYEGKLTEDKQAKATEKTESKSETPMKAESKQEVKTETAAKSETKSEEATNSISNYPEAGTIGSHIDLSTHTGSVVEDNQGKRIIVFSDNNGHKQYKSIYSKRNGYLKIIDFNGGMIYNGK